MFSSFWKKKPLSVPVFSDNVMAVERETGRWCRAQIGDYLGGEPQHLPDLGFSHDVMVGSYVCGFMQGQFIVNNHLSRWAKGDEEMVRVGFSMLASPLLEFVLGSMERSLKAMDRLPQVALAKETKGIQQMDNMGGWDGMAHAREESKQKNGLLRFYLENNVDGTR